MKKLTLNIWILSLLILLVASSGCTTPTATPVAAALPDANSTLAAQLTVTEVHALYAAESAFILDVREPDEFAAGHIPGATLIPLNSLPTRLSEIPRDQTVIVVCRSGNRSSQAQQYLQGEGFTNVHNMLGGMIDWSSVGYDIE